MDTPVTIEPPPQAGDAPANPASRPVSLVLAGGIALGAYEGGAFARLDDEANLGLDWVAGSSIGAVNAALIAGGPRAEARERVTRFWRESVTDPFTSPLHWGGVPLRGFWRRASNHASVLQTLFFGHPGVFRPRLMPGLRTGVNDVSAMYDLEPLRKRLARLVDFDALNAGPMRVSLAATDVVSGERVVFDNRAMAITARHVIASCALLPVYAPIEIDGRLLGDGALSSNTPLDLVLDDPQSDDPVCFAVDLFAREGSRPHGLTDVTARAGDLAFGNQTHLTLAGRAREYRLREIIADLAGRLPDTVKDEPKVAALLAEATPLRATLLYLSFRASLDEAGPMKGFDFSQASISERWQAGATDMTEALRLLSSLSATGSIGLNVLDVGRSTALKRA